MYCMDRSHALSLPVKKEEENAFLYKCFREGDFWRDDNEIGRLIKYWKLKMIFTLVRFSIVRWYMRRCSFVEKKSEHDPIESSWIRTM